MVVLSKQPLYDQILVASEENSNECKILLGGDSIQTFTDSY